MFIKPKLKGKFTFKNVPEIKKPNAPHNAIRKPIAAAEPIALSIENPEYFIWSNDFKHFDNIAAKINLENYELINTNDPINDFYLFKFVKHFIVGPSSFHWWAAWLNSNKEKICVRPPDFIKPTNNIDFWPSSWIKV